VVQGGDQLLCMPIYTFCDAITASYLHLPPIHIRPLQPFARRGHYFPCLSSFFGMFTKLQKVTTSCIMSVCLSAWDNLVPTEWILMKFDISIFQWNRFIKFGQE